MAMIAVSCQKDLRMPLRSHPALVAFIAMSSFGLALSPAAHADDMKKPEATSKDSMSKNTMKKDTMAKDSIAKGSMAKDSMSKDAMKKDAAAPDGMKK